MPIRDQYRPPASFTSTSRNEGRLACNGKLVPDLFCAKRNRNTQPSRGRRLRLSPLCVSGTPLVLHESFDKLLQPGSRCKIGLLPNDRQTAITLFQKKAFDCDVRTFQLCADYGCGFLMGEFDLRPHAYVLSRRLPGEDTEIKLYWVSSGNLGEKGAEFGESQYWASGSATLGRVLASQNVVVHRIYQTTATASGY